MHAAWKPVEGYPRRLFRVARLAVKDLQSASSVRRLSTVAAVHHTEDAHLGLLHKLKWRKA
jgi:hypothetical protein